MRSRMVLVTLPALVLLSVFATSSGAQSGSGTGTGYDDGYVFAGYEDHPVSVSQVINRPRTPTRWCVHWPLTSRR